MGNARIPKFPLSGHNYLSFIRTSDSLGEMPFLLFIRTRKRISANIMYIIIHKIIKQMDGGLS